MPKIILDNKIVDDQWKLLTDEQIPADTQRLIVPLKVWQAKRDELLTRKVSLGLLLETTDEPEIFSADVAHFELIAINFSKFTDGRGYSLGRLLRDRYGFKGELRAVGDVLQDQLFYMKRSGFNAFAIRADRNIDSALKSLNDFSETYQGAWDQPLPLFRRRDAANA